MTKPTDAQGEDELKRKIRNITFDCFEGNIDHQTGAGFILNEISKQREQARQEGYTEGYDAGLVAGKKVILSRLGYNECPVCSMPKPVSEWCPKHPQDFINAKRLNLTKESE